MVALDKVKTVSELRDIVADLKAQGKKVVHCHGVFDLLHIGHLRHLNQAKRHGDILVVTLSPDRYVDKGPSRPAFTEILRAEGLASLQVVDYVAINEWPTAVELVRVIKPSVYVKGDEFQSITGDYTGKMAEEAAAIEEVGGKLVFTSDIVFSSSNLINRYLSNLPEDVQKYIQLFSSRHSIDEVRATVDSLTDRKVLLLGDVILDEYIYGKALGKSSKSPIMAVQHEVSELFAGGVLAIANHLAAFVDKVKLITSIGEHNSYESFIKENLNPAVDAELFVKPGTPTTVKRRVIEQSSMTKLIELYEMSDVPLPQNVEQEICEKIKELAPQYDLVVVSDFGHGFLSPAMIDALVEHAPFLAVNVQTNAGNHGFNVLSKFPRADFMCQAEHEVRLEARDQNSPIRQIVTELAVKQQTRQFVVTMGAKGCAVMGEGEYVKVPVFASKEVDCVGAGDAFFSVASVLSSMGVPDELLGFIGNVAGVLALGIVGNKSAINPMDMKKNITTLMK